MDSVFFVVSKLVWLVISPDSLLVILLLSAFVLLRFKARPAFVQLGKSLFSVALIMILVIAFFPVGEWLLHPLEKRFKNNPPLPEQIDGVIVLSGAENGELTQRWQQIQVSRAADRLFHFMELMRRFPDAKHVFTGGSGRLVPEHKSSSDVAKILLADQGFDIESIIFEEAARNTFENAKLSKILVNPQEGERWVLITTAWHMPRSVGIFRQFDWEVIPYPVDYYTRTGDLYRSHFSFAQNLSTLSMAVKEWIGLLAYYWTGKISELLPAALPSKAT